MGIDEDCDLDGHIMPSILDEFFALTHLTECPSMVQGTRLFGMSPNYIFLVEPSGFEGEFRVLKEMQIVSAYNGKELAPEKLYNNAKRGI